jgi:hypothetical protein
MRETRGLQRSKIENEDDDENDWRYTAPNTYSTPERSTNGHAPLMKGRKFAPDNNSSDADD